MGAEGVACSENAGRLAVVRIDRGRPFRQRLCDHIILPGHPPHQCDSDRIPGIETAGRLASGAKIFGSVLPVETSLSCAVIRTRLRLLRMLPSTT